MTTLPSAGFRRLILSSLLLTGLFILSCREKGDAQSPTAQTGVVADSDTHIVALPRPNSGTFTYEEAEARKHEIYDMRLTEPFREWKNPTTGGALHITADDSIAVYQYTMAMVHQSPDSFSAVIPQCGMQWIIIEPAEIRDYVSGISHGNPASVLITSELDPRKSASFQHVLDTLFVPSTQIYYVR